ncbi:MAG TPA: response regulator transcription factor [Bacteroidia bacterium]|nr:response regulator transcription factor [Bacteroidia bacterium]HNU34847.1 response regulator transcription factor [Bacteroidia bacterium]
MHKQTNAANLVDSIILADDHPIFVAGLHKILKARNFANHYYEAYNGVEVLNLLKQHLSPLVILDYRMPVLDGFKTTEQIRLLYPQTKTICISGYVEERIVKQAFESGVDGYVAKEEGPDGVIEAIYAVMKGEKFLSARAQQTLMDLSFDDKAREYAFTGGNKIYTDRELQISIMLTKGKSIKEIAHELYLSANTVKTYKSRVFKKEGVKKLGQFITRFLDKGQKND